MSITIKGASSGGVDIVAPASGSDVTLTLPSTTATVETTTSSIASSRLTGALPALDGSSLTGVGVAGIVSTANATAITINSSEQVGIGAAPTSAVGFTDPYLCITTTNASLGLKATGGSHWEFASIANGNLRFIKDDSDQMMIDASGNMGLGVTPESGWHSGITALQIGTLGSAFEWGDMTYGMNMYYDTGYKYLTSDPATMYQQPGSGTHVFSVAAGGSADAAITWTTALKILNDGELEVWGRAAHRYTGGGGGITIDRTDSSGAATHIQFFTGGNLRGYISYNGSAVVYSTSSDYRLKENVEPMSGSIDRLMQLKPSRFNFIENPTMDMDGFIAHEVSEIVPEAITGEKDAMTMEEYEITPAVMDDDGVEIEPAVMGERTTNIINPQGIDQSKLVPLLTAALQDAIKRIEILENA
jgi:hypothetical protein